MIRVDHGPGEGSDSLLATGTLIGSHSQRAHRLGRTAQNGFSNPRSGQALGSSGFGFLALPCSQPGAPCVRLFTGH